MKITAYGASDDLIEIEGDLREEFNHSLSDREANKGYLAFSDGTLAEIVYDGMYRIHVLRTGSATISKVDGTDEDTDYSDKLTLEGDVTWIVFGTQCERAKRKPASHPRGAADRGGK